MKESRFVVGYLLMVALVPVFLAVNQDVPAGSAYKQVVLFLSLAAFGLVLGQFWLSRLVPRSVTKTRPAVVLRWHKIVGYSAVGFLALHPILMIARRFWVQESDPIENLLLMLRAPALLPAVAAWVVMALLGILSISRKRFRPKSWRLLHGLLSAAFAGLATWHVVAAGRHSNAAMSVLWIVLAGGAVAELLSSYLPIRSARTSTNIKGVAHEIAR
ncbi:MAG: ferric reductase-like transmembrane domain-containing protein [Acidobacteriota bacterium]|nr:ferric reductase-like transmembrane domain-containing protein [Acidobacteriota bacterium]